MEFRYKKHIIILVGCAMLIVCGMWTIDISVSGMIIGDPNLALTNGFWERTPMQGYHIGIWLVFGSTLILVSEMIWIICDQERVKQ